MSPNGRRAWRRAAKKLRRKMGRRWRSPNKWSEERWSELVPDLEAHRAHVTGAWFRRHGFAELDPRYKIRQYIGLWGTVDGDGVEYAVKPKPFSPRSLVGMTMGARKRDARHAPVERFCTNCKIPLRLYDEVEPTPAEAAGFIDPDSYACPKCRSETDSLYPDEMRAETRAFYRIGQRLRPCPGCCSCWGHRISSAYGEIAECCGPQTSGKRKSQIKAMRKWQETLADNCDGSGVLPARRSK